MSQIERVKAIYAAFARGDVPFMLECLAPDVVWEYGSDGHGVPWLKPRRGRAEVVGFFQTLAEELEFRRFEPTAFLEGPAIVAALCQVEATVKRTGRALVEVDEVHLWHFDSVGHVSKFRHAADTHAHLLAAAG
jgi:uncharacterized protein